MPVFTNGFLFENYGLPEAC